MADGPAFRVGLGYDSHRLAPSVVKQGDEIGLPMVVGGVVFPHDRGPVAHSDGDALMHAITDALLGALGLPDIGQLFPDRDPAWKGAKSEVFLKEACRLVREQGWGVVNVDATVVVQSPKIGPRKEEIRRELARVLGVDISCVNVKGKTHELREPGAEDRVEAMAVVMVQRGG
jgi:2-C-methyl-D-erythritol 2,4-cyclodiphosphate synthase